MILKYNNIKEFPSANYDNHTEKKKITFTTQNCKYKSFMYI